MEEKIISGWLLVYTDCLWCCGSWKKRYCVLNDTGDFKIYSNDKPKASPIFIGTYDTFVDAYRSFAGDTNGTFIAVFTKNIFRLRAESDAIREEWLRCMKPDKEKDHFWSEMEESDSTEYMSMREFVKKEKVFWQSSIPATERTESMKASINYAADLIDYIKCKQDAEDAKKAFKKLLKFTREPPIENEDIVLKINEAS